MLKQVAFQLEILSLLFTHAHIALGNITNKIHCKKDASELNEIHAYKIYVTSS